MTPPIGRWRCPNCDLYFTSEPRKDTHVAACLRLPLTMRGEPWKPERSPGSTTPHPAGTWSA